MRTPEVDHSSRSELPVYQQIATQLRLQIETGEVAAGTRLPAIRSLASVLGVNRDTVSMAYESLAAAGLVQSTVGRGTFVRPGRAEGEQVALALSAQVEQLLHFDAGRPRYPAFDAAVSLHSLVPDPSLYPIKAFRQCLEQVLDAGGAELFLYGDTQGHLGLREAIADRLREADVSLAANEIVLCHGASQGIALAVRLFAAQGDTIAVESPTYHNVLGTLVSFGVRAAEVPMHATLGVG